MIVEQARTQYETAAVLIPQIESQIVQVENALSILLGRNPGPIARGKTIYELAYPAVPAGLPSQLLERRPDLAQAEQNLIAANAQIGAAKALYFPTISLTGVYGYESAHLSDLFRGPSRPGATPDRSPGRSSPQGRSPARSGKPRRPSRRRSSVTRRRSRARLPMWKTH